MDAGSVNGVSLGKGKDKYMQVEKIYEFNGHRDSLYALAHSNTHIYTAGGEGAVVEWEIKVGAVGLLLVQVGTPVYCLYKVENQDLLLVGSAMGNIHVIDLANRKEIKNIKAHYKGIFDIKQEGDLIIVSGGDGVISMYNLPELSFVKSIQVSSHSCRSFSICNNDIIIASSDHHLYIHSFPELMPKQIIKGHSNSVFAVSYSPDGKYILSGGRDALLKVWGAQSHHNHLEIAAHLLHIHQVVYSPDGVHFATTSMDKTIKVWDSTSFKLLKVIDKLKYHGHTSSVNKLYWKDNSEFITVSDDKSIMWWKIDLGE
jgi:WD40 repeat protein